MTFITSGSNSHVTNVRNMLTSVGIIQTLTSENERAHVYSGTEQYYVFARNTPIKDVAGVWLESDPWHSGTNLYNTSSGSYFNSMEGEIYLSSGVSVSSGDIVWITYAHWNGLTDNNLNIIIDQRKVWLNAEFHGNDTANYWDYNINSINGVEQLAIFTVYVHAIRDAIVQMNNSNAIQGGFSYEVGQLKVQTKLWGEGMSMEALFNEYERNCKQMMNTLKLVYDGAPCVIINRSAYSIPYAERVFPANKGERIVDLGEAMIYSYGDRVIIFNN